MKKVMKIIAGVLGAVIAVGAIVAGVYFIATDKGPFSGTVTENGNPVAGVSVTDGFNVVKTDEKGNFELDGWRKSRFVVITVPSGYQTDDYYIPVEKSTESYDFTLEKSELTAQEEHCFIQISDTEIGENGTGEWLDDIKDTVQENNPAFLIHTGDICYEDGLKKHIQEMNTKTMGCTVRYTIGNHDYVKGDYGEALYESIYGPTWYSFDVGKIHYVVTPFKGWADYKSDYNNNACWKWLQNDLANVDSSMKVVMFNHTKSPSDDYVFSFGRDELDLKQHNLIAWIFGHYHYNYVYSNNGVLNISAPRPDCGGIDSSAAGTRIISIGKDGSIRTKMHYYNLNAAQLPKDTVWSTELDGNVLFCDTVLDSGYIYSATVDDDYPQNCAVYCLNESDGTVKWSFETKNSVKNNVCIEDNNLIAMDVDGNVYCMDKSNGNLLWEKRIELGNTLGTSSAVCIDKGVIFAGTSRTVTALEIADGEIKWSVNRDKGENSPAEFMVAGDKLIVNSHWDCLAALDVSNGKTLWENNDENIRFRSSTPVVIDDSTLLVADDNAIMFVNLADGEITSKTSFDEYKFSSSAQPVFRDGIAYIPTANEGVVAFDVHDKTILWNFKTDNSILFTSPYVGKDSKTVESSPVLDGDTLIFGANDGCIYTVDIHTGDLLKKYSVGSAVLGEVCVTKDKIYAASFDGYAVCFNK